MTSSKTAPKRTVIILQARMGSTRLPNKVLRTLNNVPLLAHAIRRLQKVAPVIVATSTLTRDNPVEQLARDEQVDCFRGSEEDVLDRFYQAALGAKAHYIIRATGDNPFVDTKEAKRLAMCIQEQEADYVSGIAAVEGLCLPMGVGIEAFTFSALKTSWEKGHELHHREHVNEYILERPERFKIINLRCLPKNSCPKLRLTVDTETDFQAAQTILNDINKPFLTISTKDIIHWWHKNK